MPERGRTKGYLLVLVGISFAMLCLVVAITILTPRVVGDFAWRRPLTGSVFSLLCILGMVAVFFPQRCARRSQKELPSERSPTRIQKETYLQKSSFVGVAVTHGHHPSCEPFRAHEFALGKKTVCAACLGLFCGALISLAGSACMFLLQVPISLQYGAVFVLGIIAITAGFAPYAVATSLGPVRRFCANAVMIIGMFLTLVGVDGKVQSSALNALLITFFIFVLFTRILLSQNTHERICAACGRECAT